MVVTLGYSFYVETTPRITGMTNNSTNTARIVNSTAPLLKKASHALPNVVLEICEQSATFPILDSRVIAINPTSTITAMLIIVLTSTIKQARI